MFNLFPITIFRLLNKSNIYVPYLQKSSQVDHYKLLLLFLLKLVSLVVVSIYKQFAI